MKFRDVCKMNLVTVHINFTLWNWPTALERDVCPSVWCEYSVSAAE